MSEAFMMTQDIVEEHKNRMHHIRKYYPFFKITETSFHQYKEGNYAQLDMGYITLAILRFFIEENNFKEKDVLYGEYVVFLTELLKKDFELKLQEEEMKELAAFIFDKLKNDGRPFSFTYFDPAEHKKKTMRIRLLDSRMEDQQVYYFITADGIEFYLDTKEIHDQSVISIEQLLLEKMIRSRNFKGGTEVVRRINNEVRKLQFRKKEVLEIISGNVFEGMKAYEEFMDTGIKWFEEEQKLFQKNNELIHLALDKARQDEKSGQYSSNYDKVLDEIYTLERELGKAIRKHRELLSACMELQIKTDELVARAKIHALRSTFDFRKMTAGLMEQDRADKMAAMIEPLLNLKRKKTFQLRMIDELLTFRPDREEKGERLTESIQEEYVFEDELEEQRIIHNFHGLLKLLLDCLEEYSTMTLKQFCENIESRYGRSVIKNADFTTFLIHIGQKKNYCMEEIRKKPDTFFEEITKTFLDKQENINYRMKILVLTMLPEEELTDIIGLEMSNIQFELKEYKDGGT